MTTESAEVASARKKEMLKILRAIADDIEAGRADSFAIAWRGKCGNTDCDDWHIGMAIQSADRGELGLVWMLGAISTLHDLAMSDFRSQKTRQAMAPFIAEIQRAQAQAEAAHAVKQ
jgi:hypothetical protein